MHVACHPSILYFGTPVALLSTCNEDGSVNLAPMSSIFWLGYRCFLGLQAASKTTLNLRRTREVVINLPSAEQVSAVDRLYKFAAGGVTLVSSDLVAPPRVSEFPVHLEGRLEHEHGYDSSGPLAGFIAILEVRITRGDPDKWRPLTMSFQEYYGLGPKLHPSKLAEIPEEAYRTPDFLRAHGLRIAEQESECAERADRRVLLS